MDSAHEEAQLAQNMEPTQKGEQFSERHRSRRCEPSCYAQPAAPNRFLPDFSS
jgi:hypothetical protein